MSSIFSTSAGVVTLESPNYNASGPVCLKFYYQISTPKIELDLQASTVTNSSFSSIKRWRFSDQENLGEWSLADASLTNGVAQLRFTATKIGVTSDSPFVNIDHINLVSSIDCGATCEFNVTRIVMYRLCKKKNLTSPCFATRR